jgi:hypothetical protein
MTVPVRTPEDVLAAMTAALDRRGSAPEPDRAVDLSPVFDPVYLGSEIGRLDRLLAETAARGWIRPFGSGRVYTLTPDGARIARRQARVPGWLRGRAGAVLLALAVAGLLLFLIMR